MLLRDVRATIATALADAGVSGVYTDPPGQITPPCVIVAPDDPYLEPLTIGPIGESSVSVRFTLVACVRASDGPASLDALERLVVDLWRALPDGTEVGAATQPALEAVDSLSVLTSTVPIAVTAAT